MSANASCYGRSDEKINLLLKMLLLSTGGPDLIRLQNNEDTIEAGFHLSACIHDLSFFDFM
jgi:hypothetical protein